MHFRNVSNHLPNFYEAFPDDGYTNMYRVMRALGEVNYSGPMVPDHVPLAPGAAESPAGRYHERGGKSADVRRSKMRDLVG